jgi:prolyl-tRNA synthetase
MKKGIEVLFDDRLGASTGEKLGDADVIGLPWRVIVSKRTAGKVEVKRRSESEATVMELDACIDQLTKAKA